MSRDDRGFDLSLGLFPFTHARGDSCPATTEAYCLSRGLLPFTHARGDRCPATTEASAWTSHVFILKEKRDHVKLTGLLKFFVEAKCLIAGIGPALFFVALMDEIH